MTPEERLLSLYRLMTPDWQRFYIAYAENILNFIDKIDAMHKTLSDPVKMPIGEYNDT